MTAARVLIVLALAIIAFAITEPIVKKHLIDKRADIALAALDLYAVTPHMSDEEIEEASRNWALGVGAGVMLLGGLASIQMPKAPTVQSEKQETERV